MMWSVEFEQEGLARFQGAEWNLATRPLEAALVNPLLS
jgi:hypothetical protein